VSWKPAFTNVTYQNEAGQTEFASFIILIPDLNRLSYVGLTHAASHPDYAFHDGTGLQAAAHNLPHAGQVLALYNVRTGESLAQGYNSDQPLGSTYIRNAYDVTPTGSHVAFISGWKDYVMGNSFALQVMSISEPGQVARVGLAAAPTGLSLGAIEQGRYLPVTLTYGDGTSQTVTIDLVTTQQYFPLPEGWTRAESNDQFAFRVQSSDAGQGYFRNQLQAQDLKTGETKVLGEVYSRTEGWASDFYDVIDRQQPTVVYGSVTGASHMPPDAVQNPMIYIALWNNLTQGLTLLDRGSAEAMTFNGQLLQIKTSSETAVIEFTTLQEVPSISPSGTDVNSITEIPGLVRPYSSPADYLMNARAASAGSEMEVISGDYGQIVITSAHWDEGGGVTADDFRTETIETSSLVGVFPDNKLVVAATGTYGTARLEMVSVNPSTGAEKKGSVLLTGLQGDELQTYTVSLDAFTAQGVDLSHFRILYLMDLADAGADYMMNMTRPDALPEIAYSADLTSADITPALTDVTISGSWTWPGTERTHWIRVTGPAVRDVTRLPNQTLVIGLRALDAEATGHEILVSVNDSDWQTPAMTVRVPHVTLETQVVAITADQLRNAGLNPAQISTIYATAIPMAVNGLVNRDDPWYGYELLNPGRIIVETDPPHERITTGTVQETPNGIYRVYQSSPASRTLMVTDLTVNVTDRQLPTLMDINWTEYKVTDDGIYILGTQNGKYVVKFAAFSDLPDAPDQMGMSVEMSKEKIFEIPIPASIPLATTDVNAALHSEGNLATLKVYDKEGNLLHVVGLRSLFSLPTQRAQVDVYRNIVTVKNAVNQPIFEYDYSDQNLGSYPIENAMVLKNALVVDLNNGKIDVFRLGGNGVPYSFDGISVLRMEVDHSYLKLTVLETQSRSRTYRINLYNGQSTSTSYDFPTVDAGTSDLGYVTDLPVLTDVHGTVANARAAAVGSATRVVSYGETVKITADETDEGGGYTFDRFGSESPQVETADLSTLTHIHIAKIGPGARLEAVSYDPWTGLETKGSVLLGEGAGDFFRLHYVPTKMFTDQGVDMSKIRILYVLSPDGEREYLMRASAVEHDLRVGNADFTALSVEGRHIHLLPRR